MFGWKRRNDVLITHILHRMLKRVEDNHREMVEHMGVVGNALNEINTQIVKSGVELTGKIDELLARETIDGDDRAAIENLRATVQALDDIVPDAITDPLPDPVDPGDLDVTDPEVIDPADPVDPVEDGEGEGE